MNIVLPVHHFPPRYTGGVELYTLRLAKWLMDSGHHVEVVTIESISDGSYTKVDAELAAYQSIPVWRLKFDLMNAPDRLLWNFDNPLLGEWFEGYFVRTKPDLVHFQSGYLLGVAPLRSARSTDIRSILTLHDHWFLCPRSNLMRGDNSVCAKIPESPVECAWCETMNKRRYALLDVMTRGVAGQLMMQYGLRDQQEALSMRRQRLAESLGWLHAVIVPTTYLGNYVGQYVPSHRLHLVKLSIDSRMFMNTKDIRVNNPVRIGYIGQIAEHKGVHLLLEAFLRLSSTQAVELHIHGDAYDDAYVQRLKRKAKSDPRVFFHGRFENTEVVDILSTFSVCVVPSICYETGPLTVMEAQSAKVPVIVSDICGSADLVQDGVDGFHFQVGSVGALAGLLQRFVDSQDLRLKLQLGVQAVKVRDVSDQMLEIMNVYRNVMK